MGRLAGLKGGTFFTLLVLGVVALVVFIWERVEGCGLTAATSPDAFWYWRKELVPLVAIVVMASGISMLAILYNRFLRFVHIILASLVLVFLLVAVIFYAVDMGAANKAPTLLDGGRFDNPANDDRYCCVFGGSAQPGDCPPVHLSCRNITDICLVAVTQEDLGYGKEYLFDFTAAVVVSALVLTVLVLSLVVHCQVKSVLYQEGDDRGAREDMDTLFSNSKIGRRIPPLRPPQVTAPPQRARRGRPRRYTRKLYNPRRHKRGRQTRRVSTQTRRTVH